MSPITINHILENLTPEQAYEAGAKSGATVAKNTLLMRGKNTNRESLVWYISELLGDTNGWFTCDMHTKKDHCMFLLRHNHDKIWSSFLAGYIMEMISEILGTELEIEYTDRSINFNLEKE